jgi:hypothetical protein
MIELHRDLIEKALVKDIESRYPGFVSFPEKLENCEELKSCFEDIDIRKYAGPNSLLIELLREAKIKYDAFLGILKKENVVLSGTLVKNTKHLEQLVPRCNNCYAEVYDVNGSHRKAHIYETDRVRSLLLEEILNDLPYFLELKEFCEDEEVLKSLGEDKKYIEKNLGKYSFPMSRLTYKIADLGIIKDLSNNKTVVLDGTNLFHNGLEKLKNLAELLNASVFYFWCHATDEDIKLNIEARKLEGGWSEADEGVRNYFLDSYKEELNGKD